MQPLCEIDADCHSGDSCNPAGECVRMPLLVDDFEDANNLPSSALFAPWLHYSFNSLDPGLQPVTHRVEPPGYVSDYALLLEWIVTDVADGGVDGTGAGVLSRAANEFVDLSGYTQLIFSHQYSDLNANGCVSTPQFRVGLGCREYGAVFEATVYTTSFTWATAILQWSEFEEPSFMPPTGVPIRECLAFADELDFATSIPLEDGQCGSGTLWLDAIAFR